MILKNIRVGRPLLGARVTADNKLILLVDGGESSIVRVIDLETQKAISGFNIPLPPKSKYDVVATQKSVLVNNYLDKQVDLYGVETHKISISYDLSLYHVNVTTIVYCESKSQFAIGDDQGNVTVWSTKDAGVVSSVKNLGGKVDLIAFDRSGNYASVALSNNSIVVFEIKNPDNKIALNVHRNQITTMLFTDKLFFTADDGGELIVWSSKNLALHKRHKLEPITSICESFDKKALLITTSTGRFMMLNYSNYAGDLHLIDVLGENLCGVLFDNSSKKAVVYTKNGNLLFYSLGGDKAIEGYLSRSAVVKGVESGTKFKVLVVDDSVTMRKVVSAAVKNSADFAELYEAKDGKEALLLLEQHQDMDVMFLDWNMPTMSGAELMTYIRSRGLYTNLKVIMATTEGGQGKVSKMLRLGVTGYLVKPFRQNAIAKVTQKLLSSKKN